jgi:predicted amidohydrolase
LSLRLALAQLTSTDNLEANLKTVETLVAQALADQADVVVFPENSLYMRLNSKTGLETVDRDHPALRTLSERIRGSKLNVLLTSATKNSKPKAKNTTWWLKPDGRIDETYSKIHMFDVDVPGAPPVRESDHFESGLAPHMIEINGWKIGLSICYDLRFAELYSHYAQLADLILIPSAFLVPTGEAHWHTLLRARAIENQCYVAAPAQAGEHVSETGARRHTYGHSLVVDPWGRIVLDMEAAPGLQVVELKKELIETVRRQIPMSSHRRLSSRPKST